MSFLHWWFNPLQVEEMKKRLHKLNKIEKGLQMFLFEDQIRALTLAKRSRRAVWSQDTVLTARKIRCAVGVKGYEFLRDLGYPLPSYNSHTHTFLLRACVSHSLTVCWAALTTSPTAMRWNTSLPLRAPPQPITPPQHPRPPPDCGRDDISALSPLPPHWSSTCQCLK